MVVEISQSLGYIGQCYINCSVKLTGWCISGNEVCYHCANNEQPHEERSKKMCGVWACCLCTDILGAEYFHLHYGSICLCRYYISWTRNKYLLDNWICMCEFIIIFWIRDKWVVSWWLNHYNLLMLSVLPNSNHGGNCLLFYPSHLACYRPWFYSSHYPTFSCF
jgi:hypothetical protein